jgi:hypothetical protein
MFKFLKQLVFSAGGPKTQPTTRKPERAKHKEWDPTESIPASEVLEGNDHTDWDLWQCSVDSQMQPLTSSVRINATPSQLADLDPFARVTKNSDL